MTTKLWKLHKSIGEGGDLMNGLICDRCYQTCWAKIRSSQNEEMICPTCKSEEELSKVPVRGEEENNG